MKVIFKHKKLFLAGSLLLVGGLLAPLGIANGMFDIAYYATSLLIQLIMAFISFFGALLLALIDMLIKIAGYNDFIHSEAVEKGWVIVRDVANMFFVIALLIIAFATVLRMQSYGYQQMLAKLAIFAIMVNFSKMMTGLLIDVSQVIMMTFVNAFSEIAAGNLTEAFGIGDMLKLRKAQQVAGFKADIDNWDLVGAAFLALAMIVIATGVVLYMMLMLLIRIIFLWLLTIFSPMVFLLPVLPGGAKYSSQWWQHLTSSLVFGPLMAFGLWLVFAINAEVNQSERSGVIELDRAKGHDETWYQPDARSGNVTSSDQKERGIDSTTPDRAGATANDDSKWFASEISGTQSMFNFIQFVAMLLLFTYMAKQAAGQIASFAGQAIARGKQGLKAGLKAAKWAGGKVYENTGAKARVAALKDRATAKIEAGEGKTTRMLRRVGLASKEYKDEQKLLRREKAYRSLGGKRLEEMPLSFREDALKARRTRLEKTGTLRNAATAEAAVDGILKKAEEEGRTLTEDEEMNVILSMEVMADAKKNTVPLFERFQKATGTDNLNTLDLEDSSYENKRKKDLVIHQLRLTDRQKRAGDKAADLLTDYDYNVSTGTIERQTKEQKEAEVKSIFANKTAAEIREILSSGAMRNLFDETGKPTSPYLPVAVNEALKNIGDSPKELAALGEPSRKQMLDVLEAQAAHPELYGTEKEKAEEMLNKWKYQLSGTFNTVTGEQNYTGSYKYKDSRTGEDREVVVDKDNKIVSSNDDNIKEANIVYQYKDKTNKQQKLVIDVNGKVISSTDKQFVKNNIANQVDLENIQNQADTRTSKEGGVLTNEQFKTLVDSVVTTGTREQYFKIEKKQSEAQRSSRMSRGTVSKNPVDKAVEEMFLRDNIKDVAKRIEKKQPQVNKGYTNMVNKLGDTRADLNNDEKDVGVRKTQVTVYVEEAKKTLEESADKLDKDITSKKNRLLDSNGVDIGYDTRIYDVEKQRNLTAREALEKSSQYSRLGKMEKLAEDLVITKKGKDGQIKDVMNKDAQDAIVFHFDSLMSDLQETSRRPKKPASHDQRRKLNNYLGKVGTTLQELEKNIPEQDWIHSATILQNTFEQALNQAGELIATNKKSQVKDLQERVYLFFSDKTKRNKDDSFENIKDARAAVEKLMNDLRVKTLN